MADCRKCGADIPSGQAQVRRIKTASIGGIEVHEESFLCARCTKRHDKWRIAVFIFWTIVVLFALFSSNGR